MICHCDCCHYTFDPANYHMADCLPERYPDCGKQLIHGHRAVRPATKEEIADYIQIQKELEEDTETANIHKEAADHESHSYITYRTNLCQSHIRL